MELITPTQIYWFTRLDGLAILFTLCTVIGCIIMGVSSIIYLLTLADKSEQIAHANSIKSFRIVLPIALVGICGLLFVPSTKEAAAIWGIPAVLNNPSVQNIGTNTLGIADFGIRYLKSELEKKFTEGK